MTPLEIIQLLQPTPPDLSARFGSIEKEWKEPGLKVSGSFYFVPLRDSVPTIDDLISIAHARLVNFALPRSRIAQATAKMSKNPSDVSPLVELVTEARDLFIRTKAETGRSGELGELLLYLLVEWALNAPIVASKMYLKTSQQMPVHGTDGVHLGHTQNGLVLYWGESKMHKKLGSAIDEIAESIAKYVGDPKKRENEIRIVRSNISDLNLSAPAEQALRDYFDPYKPESNKLLESYACFAGFDSTCYSDVSALPPEQAQTKLCELYSAVADKACSAISKSLKGSKIDEYRFSYFLLPFPSVEEARKKFQDKLWGV